MRFFLWYNKNKRFFMNYINTVDNIHDFIDSIGINTIPDSILHVFNDTEASYFANGSSSTVFGCVVKGSEKNDKYTVFLYQINNDKINNKNTPKIILDTLEDAISLCKSKIHYEIINQKINYLTENVQLSTVDLKNLNLPFAIPLVGLLESKSASVYDTNILSAKYEDGASVYTWKTSDKDFGKITYSNTADTPDFSIDAFIDSQIKREIRGVISENMSSELQAVTRPSRF